MNLAEEISKAKARVTELHNERLAPGGLQDQLHALLDETLGAERDPRIVAVRARIKAIQNEAAPLLAALKEARKAAGESGAVMRVEQPSVVAN